MKHDRASLFVYEVGDRLAGGAVYRGERCCVLVMPRSSGGVLGTPGGLCSKAPKSEEEGRGYCGFHDPDRVLERRRRREEAAAERAEAERREARLRGLARVKSVLVFNEAAIKPLLRRDDSLGDVVEALHQLIETVEGASAPKEDG